MLESYIIQLDELEFHGFKFRKNKKYKNIPEEYWNKLLDEGTHYSKIKYLETMDALMLESIHLKLSYHYLWLAVSILTASLSLVLLLHRFLLLSIILLIISSAFFFICWLCLRAAKHEHMSIAMNKPLIDVIFEQNKQENED